MKRSLLWSLVILVVFTFALLITVQLSYIMSMINMRNGQFDENVKRSLYQLNRRLESMDALFYINNAIENQNNSVGGYASKYPLLPTFDPALIDSLYIDTIKMAGQTVSSLSINPRHGVNSIANNLESMQNELRAKFLYQKEVLDRVLFDLLYHANSASLSERMEYTTVEMMLRDELKNNGIPLSFLFTIADKNDVVAYSTPRFPSNVQEECYLQVLYPNDVSGNIYKIRVYFPTKSTYILSFVHLTIGSILFTLLLLAVLGFTIYMILKQNRVTEMKNDFVSNMTHELKTPVSTISLASQMLRDDHLEKSPDMIRHITGVIGAESKRLDNLVEKVLMVSLYEKERIQMNFVPLSIHDILLGVIRSFQIKVEEIGGRIEFDTPATSFKIKADEMNLTNVFSNLMENSCKYRKQEQPLLIKIAYNIQKDKIAIIVEDNGLGMKKEYVKKIFDKFYRVSSGNRHDVKGFGLGLPYVKKVVAAHQGLIMVDSTLGVGTKFTIILPLIKQ